MGLYRRKDSSVFWMSFTKDGRSYNRSTGTEDRAIAQKTYDILKGKIAMGAWHPEMIKEEKLEWTFKELAEKYVEYKAPRLKSQASVDNEKSVINLLIAEIGETEVNMISTEGLEKLQSKMLSGGNTPATVNRKFDVLKNMFSKASDWEIAGDETMKRVRKVKRIKVSNSRLRYLSKEESQALLNACLPHLMPIVATALNTGMRLGEILNLQWDRHVDLKHGFILLTEDITKNGTRREIPINAALRPVLQGLTRRLDVPYVFYDPSTGKPYKEIKHSFSSAKKIAVVEKCTKCDYQKARLKGQEGITKQCPHCGSEVVEHKGINDYHFHDNRHTFASHLVMAGVDITTVSKLLGHKSLAMTLRYAHLAQSHTVKAVGKVDFSVGESLCLRGEKEADYYDFTTLSSNQPLTATVTH